MKISIRFFLVGLLLSPALAFGQSFGNGSDPSLIEQFDQLPESQRQLLLKSAGGQIYRPNSNRPVSPPANMLREQNVPSRRFVGNERPPQPLSPSNSAARPLGDKNDAEPGMFRKTLPLFGYDIFAGEPTSFEPYINVPVPADYVVGVGDSFNVQLYGKVNRQYELAVDRGGRLSVPEIGPIVVAGMSYDEAKRILISNIKEQIIGVDVSVTMGELRSIRVFLLGDVYKPGSYSISSMSTITNALVAGGGMGKSGSLRSIKLKRGGRTVGNIDLYDLLLKGDTRADQRLYPGDVIFVPPLGESVSIDGAVVRSARYEMRGRTTIEDLIAMAGGLKDNAYGKEARLERLGRDGKKRVIDIDLSKAKDRKIVVKGGDYLSVPSAVDTQNFTINLAGHVYWPGAYQWYSNITLKDLLPNPNYLKPQAALDYVLVRHEDQESRLYSYESVQLDKLYLGGDDSQNIKLQPGDMVQVFSLKEDRAEVLKDFIEDIKRQQYVDKYQGLLVVSGNVKSPGAYPYEQGMTISKAISASQGLISDIDEPNYPLMAVIQRTNTAGAGREFLSFSLKRVLDGQIDPPIKPDDVVIFLSRKDVEYLYSADLRAILDGKIPPSLAQKGSSGVVIDKKETSVIGDDQVARNALEQAARFENRSSEPLNPENEESEVVLDNSSCRGLSELALLADARRGERFSIALSSTENSDIDVLNVRKCPQVFNDYPKLLTYLLEELVVIKGEVRNPGVFPITDNTMLDEVISVAGGVTSDADLRAIEVSRRVLSQADGADLKRIKLDISQLDNSFRLMPGDIVNFRAVPAILAPGTVRIEGEVQFPGSYDILRGERLSQLVDRAGGLSEQAYTLGTVFTRERIKVQKRNQYARAARELEESYVLAITSRRAAPGGSPQAGAAIKDIVTRLENTDPIGRIVIEADPAVLAVRPEIDIVLEPGDTIYVPPRPTYVSVAGEVLNPGAVLFESNLAADDYIQRVGGYRTTADEDRVFVIFPNGSAKPLQVSFWNYTAEKIPPGSTIYVPRDPAPFDALAFSIDISGLLSDLAVTAASIAAIQD